jgi:hypothetical protein
MRSESVTPVLSLAAYEALDVVGALLTFPGLAPSTSECTIKRLGLLDKASQSEAYTIYLFNASPAAAARTDAAIFAPVAADFAKLVGVLHVATTDYLVGTGCTYASVELDYEIDLESTTLYAVLVAVATPDYAAADDLVLTLLVE